MVVAEENEDRSCGFEVVCGGFLIIGFGSFSCYMPRIRSGEHRDNPSVMPLRRRRRGNSSAWASKTPRNRSAQILSKYSQVPRERLRRVREHCGRLTGVESGQQETGCRAFVSREF